MKDKLVALEIQRYLRDMAKSKRKRILRAIRRKEKRVERFARELRANPPKSEQWFYQLYKPHLIPTDRFNEEIFALIPDVLNRRYRYIIEIDGEIHEKAFMRRRDGKKNRIFHDRGYTVIRIKAYCMKSFENGILKVLAKRAAFRPSAGQRDPSDFAIIDGKVVEVRPLNQASQKF